MVILLKTRIKLIACSEYKLQILEGMVYTKSSIKFFVYTNLQSFTDLKKNKKKPPEDKRRATEKPILLVFEDRN